MRVEKNKTLPPGWIVRNNDRGIFGKVITVIFLPPVMI